MWNKVLYIESAARYKHNMQVDFNSKMLSLVFHKVLEAASIVGGKCITRVMIFFSVMLAAFITL
jgi:hypothetical protein